MLEETQEDAPDIFPQHLFITLTVQAVWTGGKAGDDQREGGNCFIDKGISMECSTMIDPSHLSCLM